MSQVDIQYKKAFIKYVNRYLPELLQEMKLLRNALRNMPRTVKMRY